MASHIVTWAPPGIISECIPEEYILSSTGYGPQTKKKLIKKKRIAEIWLINALGQKSISDLWWGYFIFIWPNIALLDSEH